MTTLSKKVAETARADLLSEIKKMTATLMARGDDEPDVDPDEYREEHGKCPDGYHYDDDEEECVEREELDKRREDRAREKNQQLHDKVRDKTSALIDRVMNEAEQSKPGQVSSNVQRVETIHSRVAGILTAAASALEGEDVGDRAVLLLEMKMAQRALKASTEDDSKRSAWLKKIGKKLNEYIDSPEGRERF